MQKRAGASHESTPALVIVSRRARQHLPLRGFHDTSPSRLIVVYFVAARACGGH